MLIFLRFCATGTFLALEIGGVHLSTVSRVIVRVGRALARLYNQFIRMPTVNEIAECQLKFYENSRFPRVIGAIDCTHVKIQSPGNNIFKIKVILLMFLWISGGQDAEVFRNRKGYFSINVQAIGNADLKLINVVARWPGSTHDATIFNNSIVRNHFENNLFPNSILLGRKIVLIFSFHIGFKSISTIL